MDAVAAGLGRQIGAVVQDEGDVARLGDREQDVDGAADRVVIDILQPQLETGDVAAVKACSSRGAKVAGSRAGGVQM